MYSGPVGIGEGGVHSKRLGKGGYYVKHDTSYDLGQY